MALGTSFRRSLTKLARSALRIGSRTLAQAVKPPSRRPRSTPAKPAPGWTSGLGFAAAGPRRWRLFKPPGIRRDERLPLLVMLHGCGQDAEALAASSRMNRIASRERFLVLYPEQDRLANAQGCWNWYDTRYGLAQGEAAAIDAAIDRVCLTQPVDPQRIAVAGLSAGAGMAALLATRRPERFRAVAMHSGIAPGVADSSLTAFRAMLGHAAAAPPLAGGARLPALLVIHGSADRIVAPDNGDAAARLWAAGVGAVATQPRTLRRGARYAATITDFRVGRRLAVTLCEVAGLGHAWSGGRAGMPCSDPQGPDASRMIWSFASARFGEARRSS